jgi:hypothetical protein
MKFFLTERKYREAVRREAAAPERDPAYLVKLYSENPALLRRAWCAFHNFGPDAANRLNVSESETILTPMARAVRAFAEGLAEERAGL